MFRKNVAGQFFHFQGVDSATGGIKSGVTWTVRRCIDGTFAAATGTVTEDGSTGWYQFAMSQADTNGNNIGFNFTGAGAVPQTVNIITTAANPTDAVRLGLAALPNAAAEAAGGLYTRGTGAGQINQQANGQVDSNAVKLGGTTQTGRDIGASVLLSPGTGTGQIDLASGKVLLQATQTGVTIPTVTTLTNAPSDSSGVTTLLSRLSALRAGYLDNLSAGAAALESSLQSLITTVGAAGAGLTATASAVWSVATRLLTAGTNIVLAKGTGVTGFNDLSAAQVNAEVDTALADYDGPTHAELTAGLAGADDATLAAIGALNNLSQADVRAAVGLASGDLDTQLGAIADSIPSVSEISAGMFLENSGETYGDAVAGSVVKEIADNAGGGSLTAGEIAVAVRNNLLGSRGANILFLDPGGDAVGAIGYFNTPPNLSGGGTAGYDTSQRAVGVGSYRFEVAESSDAAYVETTDVLGAQGHCRVSFYFRYDSAIESQAKILQGLDIDHLDLFRIVLVPQGDAAVIGLVDELNTLYSGSIELTPGKWNRVSFGYLEHGLDDTDIKVYVNGIEEISVTALPSGDTSPPLPFLRYGWITSPGAGRVCWFDQIYIDDGDDLSDPGNISITAKRPAAVNEDNWDTTGGTGAVDERPLSETNYKQHAASSGVRQTYTLQPASAGDVNISGANIVGYMGWAWAKVGGSGDLGDLPALILNNTVQLTMLTTTPKLFKLTVTSTSYPSHAAGIGMRSNEELADTFMYECGVVIAYADSLIPTAKAIAGAVWDEDIVSSHQEDDTAGKKLSQALILYEGN